MRQSDRMIVTSCQIPLNQGKKYVAVQLLTKDVLYCIVETKTKVQEILEQLTNYVGIKDCYLFGLSIYTDNEHLFLNQAYKVSKYASKQWKAQSNFGLDGNGIPLLTFHLRIQFYVDCHLLIREKITRHHYYLQLKENFLNYQQQCSEEQYFLLAANCLQAEIGSYLEDEHVGQYFEPEEFFPLRILQRIGSDYIIKNMPSMHKDLRGLSRGDAQMAFICEISYLNTPFNLHLYKLLTKKNDEKNFIWLAVCPKGIELYLQKSEGVVELFTRFLWTNIKKLCFEKKKFEIRVASYPDIRKYTYFANNDEKAKHLLHLCKLTHQLTMALEPKIVELKSHHENGKKIYRESYIYSDSFDLEWEQEHGPINISYKEFGTLPRAGTNLKDQRISVISSTSSNTTSGIVSDRVQSLDGSEDDLELEVLINSSSKESTESLPAAISARKKWEPYLLCRSSSVANFTYENEELSLPCVPQKRMVASGNSQVSGIATMSRADSSTSHQSMSTLRSCSQMNVTRYDCKVINNSDLPVNLCHNSQSKETRMSLSLNSLPKIDVGNFVPDVNHRSLQSCSSARNQLVEDAFNFEDDVAGFSQAIPAVEEIKHPRFRPSPSTPNEIHSRKALMSSNATSSRILTSVKVQPPVVPPSNINFHAAHHRTKIGISSLSRPLQNGKLSLNLPNNPVLHHSSQSSDPMPMRQPMPNLPPTPLYDFQDNLFIPKYEPVLTSNYKHPEKFKTFSHEIGSNSSQPNMTLSAKQCSNINAGMHVDEANSGYVFSDSQIDCNVIDKSSDDFTPDSEEIFIPPPPLYANSTSSVNNNSISEDAVHKMNLKTYKNDLGNSEHLYRNTYPAFCDLDPSAMFMHSSENGYAQNKLEVLSNISVDLNLEDINDSMDEMNLHNLITPPPPMCISGDEELKLIDLNSSASSPHFDSSGSDDGAPSLNIDILRKRSKDLDLPLITALCNDKSLLPVMNVPCATPQRRMSCGNPVSSPLAELRLLSRPLSWHLSSEVALKGLGDAQSENQQAHYYMCNSLLPSTKMPFDSKSLTKASSTTCLSGHFLNSVEIVPNGQASFGTNKSLLHKHFDVTVS